MSGILCKFLNSSLICRFHYLRYWEETPCDPEAAIRSDFKSSTFALIVTKCASEKGE